MTEMSEGELGALDALFRRKKKAATAKPFSTMPDYSADSSAHKISRMRERFRIKNRTSEPISENMIEDLEGLGFAELMDSGAAIEAISRKRRIKKSGIGEIGALGSGTAALVTAALSFITSILKFFKGRKNPSTGEEYPDEDPTEEDLEGLMAYDEDGNPDNKKNNLWQKATGWIRDNKEEITQGVKDFYLPQINQSQYDDEYEYPDQDDFYVGPGTATPPAQPQSTISDFVKKNALVLGIGAIGIGAAIFFMTNKKTKK